MTDAEGVSASITFTILASDTPVALDVSLHNAILFKYPANYNEANDRVTVRGATTIVSEMANNEYTTYSDEDDVDVDIADASGNPTAVWMPCSSSVLVLIHIEAIRRGAMARVGQHGRYRIRSITSQVLRLKRRSTASNTICSYSIRHSPRQSVRLRFTGSDIKVYAVMLLQIVAQWDVNRIETLTADPEQIDRATNLQAIQGTRSSACQRF